MNLMFLLSPLILSLYGITFVFAGVLFLLDVRQSWHRNHVRKLMQAFVTKNAMKSFSVITETNGGVKSVAPLLEMLEQQQYPQLQVLILVTETADKQHIAELRRMQRQMKKTLRIRIVRKKFSDDDRALVRRYTDGEALVWLSPTDRITKDFFIRMSLELLDENRNAIAPRAALKIDDTLRSASRALQLVAQQTIGALTRRAVTGPVVVRRIAYLNAEVANPVYVEHSTVTVSVLPNYKAKVYIELAIFLLVATVAVASFAFLQYGWYIVTLAFIGILVLLMMIRLLSYPYSLLNRLSLALLIPLWPLVSVAQAVMSGMKHAFTHRRGRRIKPVGEV